MKNRKRKQRTRSKPSPPGKTESGKSSKHSRRKYKNLKKSELQKVVKAIEQNKSFLILVHKCPDPDAAGAAIALASALKQKHKKVVIGVKGDSFSKSTKLLLKKTGFKITSRPDYNKDCIIVVDTNSPALFPLDEVLGSGAVKIIIDHHHPKPEVIDSFDYSLIDEQAVSTTQILFHLLDEMDVKFTHTMCLAIAAGILTDSANFVAATIDSFIVLGDVLARGKVPFREVLASISVTMDLSEKIARLKAAQRLKFYREGNYLITSTKIGSFEGGVAKAMLYVGADVSFVGASHGTEVRISARAKNAVIDKGLHLGKDVMPLVADLIGGDAGGHAGAAGANGTRSETLDEALRVCVERTKEILKGK